jgi:imidazolonepropionase-like amidohydrolase
MKCRVLMQATIVFIFCLVLTPLLFSQNPPRTIALINGTLIDGTGAAHVPNSTVVIQSDRIIAVGSRLDTDIPSDAEIIDAKGLTILPGFINSHVHNAFRDFNLKTWARDGVTTVRDLATRYAGRDLSFWRNRLNSDPQNTRMITAFLAITAIRGYSESVNGFPSSIQAEISGTIDARQKTNEQIDKGADLIKVLIEDDLYGQQYPMLTLSEIKAVVETAHERGFPVSAHVSRTKHLELAIEAGVDDMAHMIIDDLSKKLIDRMIAKNIYCVPTLELWKVYDRMYQTNWEIQAVENLRRFVQAGGKVALGTDIGGASGSFQSGMPIIEMELMQEAGMTPMQIIVAATKHGAHVCNREKELGTIEPGKIADIILIEGNPLKDIHNLKNLKMVIHNGKIL